MLEANRVLGGKEIREAGCNKRICEKTGVVGGIVLLRPTERGSVWHWVFGWPSRVFSSVSLLNSTESVIF